MRHFISTFRSRFLVPRAEAILNSLASTIVQLEASIEKHDEEAARFSAKAYKAQAVANAAYNEADRAHRVAGKLRDLLS